MNYSEQLKELIKKSLKEVGSHIDSHGEKIEDSKEMGLNVYSFDLLLNGVCIIHITTEHAYDEDGNVGSLLPVVEKYPKEFFNAIDFYSNLKS